MKFPLIWRSKYEWMKLQYKGVHTAYLEQRTVFFGRFMQMHQSLRAQNKGMKRMARQIKRLRGENIQLKAALLEARELLFDVPAGATRSTWEERRNGWADGLHNLGTAKFRSGT